MLIKRRDNATGMLPQLMNLLASLLSGAKAHVEPLKAYVSGGANYPLEPVTPGYQDAVLTKVKRAVARPNPKSIIVYTQAHGDGLCTLTHKYADRNLVYWQISDSVNTGLTGRWLKTKG